MGTPKKDDAKSEKSGKTGGTVVSAPTPTLAECDVAIKSLSSTQEKCVVSIVMDKESAANIMIHRQQWGSCRLLLKGNQTVIPDVGKDPKGQELPFEKEPPVPQAGDTKKKESDKKGKVKQEKVEKKEEKKEEKKA